MQPRESDSQPPIGLPFKLSVTVAPVIFYSYATEGRKGARRTEHDARWSGVTITDENGVVVLQTTVPDHELPRVIGEAVHWHRLLPFAGPMGGP